MPITFERHVVGSPPTIKSGSIRVRMADVRGADGTVYEDRVEWLPTAAGGWETWINRSHLEVAPYRRDDNSYFGLIAGKYAADPSESAAEVMQTLLEATCFD